MEVMLTLRRRALFGIVVLGSATALLASGCGSSGGGSSSSSPKTVLFGEVNDFSGGEGPVGTDTDRGLMQFVDEVNSSGGIKSLGGAKITVKKFDTQTNPDLGSTEATQAVNAGVKIVIGGEVSDTVIAATNVSARAGVPWIDPGGSDSEITARGFNNVFQTVPNTSQAAQGYFNVMKAACEQFNCGPHPTMAIAVSDTSYGTALDAAFTALNESNYFDIVTKVSYPDTTTDFSSIAQRLASDNPEIIYNEGYPVDGLSLAQDFATTVTTKAKVFLGVPLYQSLASQLGAKSDGVVTYGAPSTLFKGMPAEFTTQNAIFEKKWGYPMSLAAVQGYVDAALAYQAFQQAGSTDGTKVAAALHKIHLTHAEGNLFPMSTLSFLQNGAMAEPYMFEVQMQNGKAVGVYPTNIATASIIAYR